MSYNPQDHSPSTKQVVAAWAICLGIAGLALGLTLMHQDVVPDAVADSMSARVAAYPGPGPLTGVHIPEFAICQVEPGQRLSIGERRLRGPMAAQATHC
jgi:hypothetical protein